MANNMYILLTTDKNNNVAFAAQQGGPSSWFYRKLTTLFGQLGLGAFNSKLDVVPNLVAASGTVTFSSVAAADTVTIGVTVFTGNNSPTGAQFQTNATPSAAADIVAAASLASVINSNATTSKLVVASNVAGTAVVTVTALVPGLIGNFFPIAISAHGSVSGSGKLASGTQGTIASYRHGL